MKKFIILISALLITALPSFAQESNYCHDKQSWEEWDALARKYPNSQDVQTLHAVRIGLCRKIEAGSISFEVANDAFNHMHEIVIKKAQKEKKRYLEDRTL